MSEVRVDPWSGLSVVIAPGRASIGAPRPTGLPQPSGRCPFCPGHEADAEPTVAARGEPWRVRAVTNRYPLASSEPGWLAGRHEVIVESRAHDTDLADMDAAALFDVLDLYRDRAAALASTPGTASVVLFRNRGRRAGSSQPHPHAQIVALPFVPPLVAAREAIASREPDLFDRVLDEERRGPRAVRDREGWVSFCPFASSRAHEVRIVPSARVERFAHLSDAALTGLSTHLAFVLRGLHARMGLSDYNVLVREPPLGSAHGFLVIEILPRTGGDAGFELLTGASICVVAPEETAAALRHAPAS
jgi:UDPglucose--hexose-1-phosphate uridylyltransferase